MKVQIERIGDRLCITPDSAEGVEGDWVGLELPSPGARFAAGDTFGFLTTDRAVHDLRAPEAFIAARSNADATANPALAQLSPTGRGWLVEVDAPRSAPNDSRDAQPAIR